MAEGKRRRKHGGRGRNKYVKIPLKTKVRFLKKVIADGTSIRDAAVLFNSNYSTAKTLIRQHRKIQTPYDFTSPTQHSEQTPQRVPTIYCPYISIEIQKPHDLKSGDSKPNLDKCSIASQFYLFGSNQRGANEKGGKFGRIEIISRMGF